MKKIMFISAMLVLAVVLTAFVCSNKSIEKAKTKPVEFSVYKSSSYMAPAYQDARVSLQITITAEKGNKKEVLWQHTYPSRRLSEFPQLTKAALHQVQVKKIVGAKEKIRINYQLKYDNKGSIINTQNTAVLAPHTGDNIVRIAI